MKVALRIKEYVSNVHNQCKEKAKRKNMYKSEKMKNKCDEMLVFRESG